MSPPGKITVYMYTDWQLTAHLHEYAVNSPDPRPEHRAWIKENVTKYRQREMTALIFGLASRTGTPEHNIKLSKARAEGISSEIQRLDFSSLLIDTRFALGEEAAKLVGFKDSVEDGRWRGVFLDLYNPAKVPNYGPPLRPKKFVERRVAVTIGIDQKETNAIPKDNQDRKAEGWARRARQAGQAAGMEVTPHKEEFDWIDDTWDVAEVSVKVREHKDPYIETTWLDVKYVWGHPGGQRVLHHAGKKLPLSADDAVNWLERPVRTYRRGLWLRH